MKLSGMNLSVSDNHILNTLLYSISDIERMADHAMAVAKAALEMEEKRSSSPGRPRESWQFWSRLYWIS